MDEGAIFIGYSNMNERGVLVEPEPEPAPAGIQEINKMILEDEN